MAARLQVGSYFWCAVVFLVSSCGSGIRVDCCSLCMSTVNTVNVNTVNTLNAMISIISCIHES